MNKSRERRKYCIVPEAAALFLMYLSVGIEISLDPSRRQVARHLLPTLKDPISTHDALPLHEVILAVQEGQGNETV